MTATLLNQLLPALICAAFAIGFAIFWYYRRSHASALAFSASYATTATAFFIEALAAPGALSPVKGFADLLYIIAPFLFAVAASMRFRTAVPWPLLIPLTAGGIVAALWLRFLDPDMTTRIAVISMVSAALVAATAVTIWPRLSSRIDHSLGLLLFVFALAVAANALVTLRLVDADMPAAEFRYTAFMAALNLIVSLAAPMVAVCLLISYGVMVIRELEIRVMSDPVTGLPNRTAFERSASEVLVEADASGEAVTLLLCSSASMHPTPNRPGEGSDFEPRNAIAAGIAGLAGSGGLAGHLQSDVVAILLMGRSESEVQETVMEAVRLLARPGQHGENGCCHAVVQRRLGETLERFLNRAEAVLYLARHQMPEDGTADGRTGLAALQPSSAGKAA